MFSDTDMLTTTIWSDVLFHKCPEWASVEAEKREYDLYLVPDVDVPWVPDNQRYFKEQKDREDFRDRCVRELVERDRNYRLIKGDWDNRFIQACAHVNDLLKEEKCLSSC
jgi:nicotinamide riboside kinase